MAYRVKEDCLGMDWQEVQGVIVSAGLEGHSASATRMAFENSYARVFVFDDDRLVATGRALSDGAYQAALYDMAVLPEYQGKGIGKRMLETLESRLQNTHIILYAHPNAQGFYHKLGYSKMLTGMAKFRNEDAMRNKGFIE